MLNLPLENAGPYLPTKDFLASEEREGKARLWKHLVSPDSTPGILKGALPAQPRRLLAEAPTHTDLLSLPAANGAQGQA